LLTLHEYLPLKDQPEIIRFGHIFQSGLTVNRFRKKNQIRLAFYDLISFRYTDLGP